MKETSYLHHLTFPEKLRNSFIARYLANPRLLILLLLLIIGIGSVSYSSIPHRLNPEIKIPIVVISDVLPGANPQDVESLVSKPIEDAVSGVSNIKTVSSTSQDNVSITQIEFNSGVDPEKARADVQSAVDQATLPSDAQAPKVIKVDFENQPVWTFALTGNDDVASLNRLSKRLATNLENLPNIDKVTTSGLEEREINVLIDQAKIATYGISPIQLSTALKSALGSFPAGIVTSDNSTFALSIDPSVTTIEDIRNLKIAINGLTLPLESLATITERSKPNQSPSYIASNDRSAQRSITFSVYKTSTANIDRSVKDAEAEVDKNLKDYNSSFSIKTITNTGELVTKQFDELIKDFAITIALVFIVLFVFLGARPALVSLFSVPLTFLITFSVMNLMGISLNFLSMFSLLLSLGLLVDDTIVIISAMTSYYQSGKFTPLQTGLLVWRDFVVVIVTTTLTTVWAFFPLLLSSGLIGDFIKAIPIVVSATLIGSFIVAMIITLPLMIILLKPELPKRVVTLLKILLVAVLLIIFINILPKGPLMFLGILAMLVFLFVTAQVRQQLIKRSKNYITNQSNKHPVIKKSPSAIENGFISFERISNAYRGIISKILSTKRNRRRAVIMVVALSVFSYLLLPLGFVKNEFFPKSDEDYLYINVELPAGTRTEITNKEALRLLDEIRQTKDVSYVVADVGQTFSGDTGSSTGGGGNSVLFSLALPENRKRTSIEIANALREQYASYAKGKLTLAEVSGGPPAGADLQIKLYGDDLSVLDKNADKIVAYLKSQKGVVDITKSIKPGTSKIVFIPDQAALTSHNVTVDQIGLTMRTFASGFTLDSATLASNEDSTEKEDITLRSSNDLQEISAISTITIPTPNGNLPLLSLGKLVLRPNPTLITREENKRTLSVSAGVSQGYSTSTLNKGLEDFANSKLSLADGYTWKTGGVNEENNNSVLSILEAMLLSFALIIVTMVIQFSSFRKAVIVMLVIPLSISGVFIIFSLTHTPLSFPALIGVLALFGIVVKNSILIVDKISANQKIGMDFVDAITDGAASRLEPIALTSLAAIMGLIPITISDPLWRGLGGAIIAGLTFSGTIMLFFIPIVYYIWFESENVKKSSKSVR